MMPSISQTSNNVGNGQMMPPMSHNGSVQQTSNNVGNGQMMPPISQNGSMVPQMPMSFEMSKMLTPSNNLIPSHVSYSSFMGQAHDPRLGSSQFNTFNSHPIQSYNSLGMHQPPFSQDSFENNMVSESNMVSGTAHAVSNKSLSMMPHWSHGATRMSGMSISQISDRSTG